MQPMLPVLALVLAIGALAVAGYGIVERKTSGSVSGARLQDLEEQVAELQRALAQERNAPPRLLGLDLPATSQPPPSSASPAETPSSREETAEPDAPGVTAEEDEQLRELVDQAVERKAEEMRVKAENKKPHIDLFTSMLELTDAQRAATEEEIMRGQQEVIGILDTVTDDGRNLLDELVEHVAVSVAKPGTPIDWGKWYGGVVSNQVPGTNQTYAARIEEVKASMRTTFRGIWSEEQYAEFEAWGVDPT
ncbi:MAG: hypothetical protein ACYTG6_08480, partial [Planctomycetota bacterium]